MKPFDARPCELGEGLLWHPMRRQLFWFDILGQRLLSRDGDCPLHWDFDDKVSAAGWVDAETLLIASETALLRFDIASGRSEPLIALEAATPGTRSNDGRADPFGGFWIGTMGKQAEPGAGAIYRFYQGGLRRIFSAIGIPNTIAFAPDGRTACFSDTPTRMIMRVGLGTDGWPDDAAEPWIDLRDTGEHPDGAVFDDEGHLWVALWGVGRVARFAPDGTRVAEVEVPAPQPTCPAFCGADLDMLCVTTAREGMSAAALADAPASGTVLSCLPGVTGRPEHRVFL